MNVEPERSPQGDFFSPDAPLKPVAESATPHDVRVRIGEVTFAYRATKLTGTITTKDLEYRYHTPPGQYLLVLDRELKKQILREARIAINKMRRAAGTSRKRRPR